MSTRSRDRSPPITAHLAAVLVPDDAGGHGGVGAVAAVEGEVVPHHDVDNVKTWQLTGLVSFGK